MGRLLDMGVEPYLLASTLLGIVAQRLVRTPCPHCSSEDADPGRTAQALDLPATARVTRGSGCARCRQTGYLGRTGVYEILGITPAMADAVHECRSTAHLKAVARKGGMRTLREAGVEKVLEGLTSPAEILAVTPPDEGHEYCRSTPHGAETAANARGRGTEEPRLVTLA